MKKLLLLGTLTVALITQTGCTPDWRRNQELLNAENYARIAVVEAEAELEATLLMGEAALEYARIRAESEIIMAEATQEAMEIVQKYITEDYLIHFWIRTLENHEGLKFVATESGLPIIMNPNIAEAE